MKRKLLFSIAALVLVALFAGCSNQPYNYDLSEYITFSSDYKTIQLDMDAVQSNVDTAIEDIKSEYSTTTEVTDDRAAADGDTVSITYAGKMLDDNSSPEGISNDEESDLVLGSDTMIEGFEDGIIGMKKGETKTLHLTFPSDYHATELAGRAVDFDVTVHKLSTTTAGEFTDEIANEISGGQYTTAAEYTEYLLKEEKLAAVQEKLYELASFKVKPEKEIRKEYETYVNNYKVMALNNGQTLEDYIYASYQQDLNTFLKTVAQEAATAVQQKMTIYYVLQQEGKTVTGEIYDTMAEELFGEYLETYESYYGKEYVENTIAVRYACQLVLDQIG